MLSMLNALSWPSCCLRLRIARLSQSQTARQYQDIAKRSWLRFLKGISAFCYHWSVVIDWCNTQINYNKNGLQRKRSNRMNRMNRKETCRRYKNGSMINTLVTAWACGLPWWASWGRANGWCLLGCVGGFFRVVAGGIGIAEKLWAGEFMT